MKHIKYLFFITIITSILFLACKSNGKVASDTTCNSCEDAFIRYYGDPALDGCGWVVDVSSTIYMPNNLAPEFYVDSLNVRIKYKVLERVNCGLVKDAHLAILIEEIHKK